MSTREEIAWLIAAIAVVGGFGASYVAYGAGEASRPECGAREPTARSTNKQAKDNCFAKDNECVCGARQTCPFGPGVVGEQTCITAANYLNRWSRCEPQP